MFKVVKNNNQKILSQGSIDYLLIEKWSDTLEDALVNCGAVVITTREPLWYNDIILQLRTHKRKDVFLTPIFYKHDVKSEFAVHTDGPFEENLTNETVKRISERIQKTPELQAEKEFDVSTRLLQFLNTREAVLNPVKNRHSKTGYIYPFIGLYYTGKEYDIEKQLQTLVNDKMLESSLKDKVQLCNDCHDSYLIYKETCPKCKSIDLKAHDIIHHFTCAHVAPQEQFTNNDNDELQCPKCDKHLRHIGIDYDKPSSVYNCNTCDHDFQGAEVLAECHSCHHVNSLEALIEVSVYDYELTMKGVLKAEGKYEAQKSELSNETLVFNQLLSQEKQRNFAKGRSSYLMTLSLTGELLQILDSNYINRFWKDMQQVVKTYVINDLCYLKTGNTIKLLLLDMQQEEVETLKEKLVYNMNLLLTDNIKSHINIEYKMTDIQKL